MKFANFLSLIRCKLKVGFEQYLWLQVFQGRRRHPWRTNLRKLNDSPLMNLGRINFTLDDIHNRDVTVIQF